MLGGALSWDEPQPLSEFPGTSPFAGLTPPANIYNPAGPNPNFDVGGGASPWTRIDTVQRIPSVRQDTPEVVRFDWTPPATLTGNTHVALLALCAGGMFTTVAV